MRTNIVALTAGLAATTSAAAFTCTGNYFSFYNRDGNALSYQRLDPALYPGTQSPHLHSFDGGNGLSASTSFDETQASTCTTARIKTDKSLYWRPSLFWNGNGTGFYRVPEKSSKVYYKFGDGNSWANVTGFPKDFNMIAGNPFKRAEGDNPAGVQWGCHEPDGGSASIFSKGFPKGFRSCDYGFASEVTFPSCWNGKMLDPKNPSAHMAYPNGVSGVGIENCPTTHRAARFPTIFIEFWYDISSFNGQYDSNSVPWVLSNGDPTGYGFHGDFLNGWETGVLEKAIAQTGGCNCGCGCGQTEMEQCFGAENVNKDTDADFLSCSAPSASNTDSKPVLAALPGCNPLQSGPADATAVSGPSCTATTAPTSGGSKSSVVSSAAGIPSTMVSSKIVSSIKASATSSQALSVSVQNKQVDNVYGPTSVKGSATPTPIASSKVSASTLNLLSLSLATTAVPAGSTANPSGSKPSGTLAGSKDKDCTAPVYVTVTPTVYVTVGMNSTSCSLGTITKTHTQTATITVPAQGNFEYGSY